MTMTNEFWVLVGMGFFIFLIYLPFVIVEIFGRKK